MRVLIADDSLLSRRLLEQTLQNWGYEAVVACDGSQAWSILDSPDAPPLAILDWMMPGHSGPELCRLVRDKGREPYTYILLLTSRNEKEDVVAGLDSGADDYIIKPFDKHELKVRLRAGRRIIELQEQLVTAREALREQATRDYLTQAWNRSAILEHLERELSRSRREGTYVGVVLGDLDHFKSINDTWGHAAGDLALRHAAGSMLDSLRPYDSVGRYGGEEFLLVLPGANLQDTTWLTDRVRLAIRATPVVWEGNDIPLTCSFGCTSGFGGRYSAETLIQTADEALYAAKRAGRDRVTGQEIVPAMAALAIEPQDTLSFEPLETGLK